MMIVSCSTQLAGFVAKTNYVADGFNEKTLSGNTICTGLLFDLQGKIITDTMNEIRDLKKLSDFRSDLKLILFSQVKNQLDQKIGTEQCDSLFLQLYSGTTVQMQLLDKLWKSVDSDFMMVMYIRDAMNIKTFDNAQKKRVRIEASLWNCRDQESVWRVEVFGIVEGGEAADREVINAAVKKVYESLPYTVPAYESGKW